MIERILRALKLNEEKKSMGALWDMMTVTSKNTVINVESLDNMCMNGLTMGFMGYGIIPYLDRRETLIKMTNALGIYGIKNPEGNLPQTSPNYQNHITSVPNPSHHSNNDLLRLIEQEIGFNISFPPFIGGRTETTSHHYGVYSNRHIDYLWVIKRIMELCPDRNSRILEIGAGIGLLGYYLSKNGYNDYTLIDIARTNVCQAYFLYKNLPERDITLSHEVENPFDEIYNHNIRVLHTTDFSKVPKDRYDLMVNIDGLTEFPIESATNYVNSNCVNMLLSINHEANPFRVTKICQKKLLYRYPYWLRDGYVEELYKS